MSRVKYETKFHLICAGGGACWSFRGANDLGGGRSEKYFWSDGLAIASGGLLYSGPSLCLSLLRHFPERENRAIDFSDFLHET